MNAIKHYADKTTAELFALVEALKVKRDQERDIHARAHIENVLSRAQRALAARV